MIDCYWLIELKIHNSELLTHNFLVMPLCSLLYVLFSLVLVLNKNRFPIYEFPDAMGGKFPTIT